MNTRLLKARIILQGKNNSDICAAIGISQASWFRKLSGESEFKQSEIKRLRNELDLDDHETALIFFNENVS